MRFKKTLITMATLLGVAIYVWWPGDQADLSSPPLLYLEHTQSYGQDTGHGNVVGIEPFMEPLDYATPARLQEKLDGYFDSAAEEGWFSENTIVLLPEHLGTGLLAVGAKSRSFSDRSTTDAALPLIAANLQEYLKNLFIFDDKKSAAAAFVRTRTRAAAGAALQVFGNLARQYGVTIVAGSSLLMTPGAYPDSLSYGHGPIFNAAFVFGPDGRPVIDATRKLTPEAWEKGLITEGQAKFLFPYPVAGRRVGVLIGRDLQSADAVGALAGQQTDVFLVPDFMPDSAIRRDTDDTPLHLKASGIRWAMKVNLKGTLWGYTGVSTAWIMENGAVHARDSSKRGAAIYNLWLGTAS